MQFIEMTGRTLKRITTGRELSEEDLQEAGVNDDSVVRVNPQGDIEVRTQHGWEIIGGLLGEDFQERVQNATGLEWA